MPTIYLGKTTFRGLSGEQITRHTWIEAETDKAILLKRRSTGEGVLPKDEEYWLPKSQCRRNVVLGRECVTIPDWLWEKKR